METWLSKKLKSFSGTVEYEAEKLAIDVSEKLVERLVELGMKRSELAERVGVDRAVVTRCLSGTQNMTLRSLVSLATALDLTMTIEMRRRERETVADEKLEAVSETYARVLEALKRTRQVEGSYSSVTTTVSAGSAAHKVTTPYAAAA